ncbi:MAG: hypothetical protein AB7F43_03565 [Bacteriovoracia bacterium]
MSKQILVFTLLLACASAFGASKRFDLPKGTVEFDIPSGWQSSKGLLGMPLVILSPEIKGQKRAVLGVVPITKVDYEITPNDVGTDSSNYKKGREKFLRSQNGKSLEYFPLEPATLGESKGFTAGYKYKIGSVVAEEHTYYVVCNKTFFHLKTLYSEENKSRFEPEMKKTLESFRCPASNGGSK